MEVWKEEKLEPQRTFNPNPGESKRTLVHGKRNKLAMF